MFVPVCVCCVRRVARRTWAAGWESFWQKPVPLLTPESLHYDYADVETIANIRTAARHSFLWVEGRRRWGAYIRSSWWFWPPCFFSCLFRWATSTDSRTYDEVPFEAIEVCGRRWTNIWSSALHSNTVVCSLFSEDTFYKPTFPSKRNLFTKKHLILCAQT